MSESVNPKLSPVVLARMIVDGNLVGVLGKDFANIHAELPPGDYKIVVDHDIVWFNDKKEGQFDD